MTGGPTEPAAAASSRCCHPGITRARPGWCRGGSGWNGYRSGTHSTTHDRRRRQHGAGVLLGLGEDSGGHGCSHGTSIGGIPRRCQPSARTVTGVDRRSFRRDRLPDGRRAAGPPRASRPSTGGPGAVRGTPRTRDAGVRAGRRIPRETPSEAAASRRVGGVSRRRRRLVGDAADARRPRRHGRSRVDGGVGGAGATRPGRRGGRRRRRGPGRCSRSRRASRRARRGRC